MVNPSIVRRFSVPVSGLVLTWFVIRIPGQYADASVWLMPTVAAFFALATWFALACRGMEPWRAFAWKRSGSRGMAAMFDLVGKACFGAGILSALIQIVFSPGHCSWELPFASGVGIFIGAHALARIPI